MGEAGKLWSGTAVEHFLGMRTFLTVDRLSARVTFPLISRIDSSASACGEATTAIAEQPCQRHRCLTDAAKVASAVVGSAQKATCMPTYVQQKRL